MKSCALFQVLSGCFRTPKDAGATACIFGYHQVLGTLTFPSYAAVHSQGKGNEGKKHEDTY